MGKYDHILRRTGVATNGHSDDAPPPFSPPSVDTFAQNKGKSGKVSTSTLLDVPKIKPFIPLPEWVPFPVETLPDPVASYVMNASGAIGCDPASIAIFILPALAAAIGTTRRIVLKRGWTEPPVLWSALIADSGEHKSPAMEKALSSLRKRQSKAMRNFAASMDDYKLEVSLYERDVSNWKKSKTGGDPPEAPTNPVCVRYVVDDATIEALAPIMLDNPRGVLIARDELAAWFGGFDRYSKGKGGDSAKWLELHGGRSIIIDRKTGSPRTIYVPLAAASVTGGIQPGTLKRLLTPEHYESGMAARLLFCQPPKKQKQWTENEIDQDIEDAISVLFDDLCSLQHSTNNDGDPHAVLVGMTPAAKDRWIQFYNSHAAESAELSGELSAAWSKLEGYTARLALIIHYVKHVKDDLFGDRQDIDESSIEAAIILSRWFAGEAKRLYGVMAESPEDTEVRELVEVVKRHGGRITARDLTRLSRKYRGSTEDAEAALARAVEAGAGVWEMVHTSTSKRRDFRIVDAVDVDTFT